MNNLAEISNDLDTAESGIYTQSYGGTGGAVFALAAVKEIGLRTGDRVDQITVNGVAHGGNGGSDRGSITLDDDEYICKVSLRSGDRLDAVTFTTNKQRSVGGGGTGGSSATLENIRVLAIGGRSGTEVDNLSIMYIANYHPSTDVEEDAAFVIGFTAPGTTMSEYQDATFKEVDMYEKITSSMLKQNYSASVEGEYYAKVTASTSISIENAETTTVRQELEQELKQGKRTEVAIPQGSVGILQVSGTIMKSASGKSCWMFPTSSITYAVIGVNETANVLGYYDLTGLLSTQMPGLKGYKTVLNGYVYYNLSAVS